MNAIPRASAADIVKAKSRGCKKLEGKYITLDNDEIFLVQKCKKDFSLTGRVLMTTDIARTLGK